MLNTYKNLKRYQIEHERKIRHSIKSKANNRRGDGVG